MKPLREEMDEEHPVREANKICGVCGDRALGYNFNAVSCESCKAFFRRNALRKKDFRCPFTENCNISPVTRRFCQKCRLDKCFNIGMRKEYIMSEEDKVLKRQKIEQNRAKKRPNRDGLKVTKMKKESIDELNFDNDTSASIASVVSTGSTITETYFWESDRKYTDLDANRQSVIDSMSPVPAASVPSPLSPPENLDIAGSKTLEMLKDSYNSSPSYHELSPRANTNQSIKIVTPHVDKKTSPVQCTTKENSTNSPIKENLINKKIQNEEHGKLKYNSESCSQCTPISCSSNSTNNNLPITKNCHTKNSNIAMKISQDPELISKMVNNPHLLSKIFMNQDVLMKIITDPETLGKLTENPTVSQLLQENIIDLENENIEVSKNEIDHNDLDIHDNCDSEDLEEQSNQIENPILTNLITNNSPDEEKIHIDESSSKDWNKMSDDVTKDVLQEVQRLPITPNSMESILCKAIKLEFFAFSSLGANLNSRELNDSERAKLNELIVASKALHAPLDDDISSIIGDEYLFQGIGSQFDPALLDVINLTAVAIRRLIKMSKKISAFKNMCEEDQLALLKGGCTEMMILRSAINYDPDKHVWKIPHTQERMSNIKVDVLKEAKGNLFDEHTKFFHSFDPQWKDENIILILSAIALFTPERPKVVHSDVVKLEQNSYYYLLRRYLESMYPGCVAKSTFLKLIQKISELHRLNDEVVGVYLNVNPSSVEPLLIEIFDLKQ